MDHGGAGMVEVDVRQAKTHFSRLLARVETGEEVLILRAGRPVARLVSFRRKAGRDKGKGWIAADDRVSDKICYEGSHTVDRIEKGS